MDTLGEGPGERDDEVGSCEALLGSWRVEASGDLDPESPSEVAQRRCPGVALADCRDAGGI